ncbi:MAG: hypothetical protein Q9195_002415 [Heterodermia aff. obscurata]
MAEIPKEQPEDDPDDVLFNTIYGVRTIELNRPQKLNSLNASMARKIIPRLKEWENSELAQMIIIAGNGDRSFCAGGDVAALAKQNSSPAGIEASKAYFQLEYQLDHLIATYTKPYIAYMDGITMGGGVGLSVHAPFRIATERTVFGMPETSIGFFPDVGGSFFLPRLDGYIGTYLALTSAQLKGVQAYWTGVATHYIHSSALSSLTARLGELVFKDYYSQEQKWQSIDDTIEEFSSGVPHDEPALFRGAMREAVDRCFQYDTVEEILIALRKEAKEAVDNTVREWATTTIKTINEKSPTSLKVALRQMRVSPKYKWSIADTFQREYEIAARFMKHPDFVRGVSAKLIQKPPSKPTWEPPRLEDVDDSSVDDFFAEGEDRRMVLLSAGVSYKEYPHSHLALPSEEEVEHELRSEREWKSKKELVKAFFKGRKGKAGVKEKVEDVLARKCAVAKDGRLIWSQRDGP